MSNISKIYNFSLIIIFQKYQISFISLCMWLLQMFNIYVLYSLAFICNISFVVRSTYIIRSLRIIKIDNTQKTMSIVMCPEIVYRITRLTKAIHSKNIWNKVYFHVTETVTWNQIKHIIIRNSTKIIIWIY